MNLTKFCTDLCQIELVTVVQMDQCALLETDKIKWFYTGMCSEARIISFDLI